MYKQIKQLADEALALQNKDRMDAALREISGLCDPEVLRQLADSVMLASTTTSFPFDRQPAELMPENAISPGITTHSGGFLVAGDHNPNVLDFPATEIAPPAKQTAPEPDLAPASKSKKGGTK